MKEDLIQHSRDFNIVFVCKMQHIQSIWILVRRNHFQTNSITDSMTQKESVKQALDVDTTDLFVDLRSVVMSIDKK